MRETVYISYGFQMRAGPLGPLNALNTKIFFFGGGRGAAFFQIIFFYSFGEPLGLLFHGVTVGPYINICIFI